MPASPAFQAHQPRYPRSFTSAVPTGYFRPLPECRISRCLLSNNLRYFLLFEILQRVPQSSALQIQKAKCFIFFAARSCYKRKKCNKQHFFGLLAVFFVFMGAYAAADQAFNVSGRLRRRMEETLLLGAGGGFRRRAVKAGHPPVYP
jgi:hypothetical protein